MFVVASGDSNANSRFIVRDLQPHFPRKCYVDPMGPGLRWKRITEIAKYSTIGFR